MVGNEILGDIPLYLNTGKLLNDETFLNLRKNIGKSFLNSRKTFIFAAKSYDDDDKGDFQIAYCA